LWGSMSKKDKCACRQWRRLMKIREMMAEKLTTVEAGETLEAAAKRMTENGVSGAPVVDREGNLVGILSESDILKHMKTLVDDEVGMRYLSDTTHSLSLFVLLAERDHEVREAVFKRLRAAKVGKAMTSKVITAKPNDTIESVAAQMIEHNVNRIPIVEGEKVVGMVTKADFARLVATGQPR